MGILFDIVLLTGVPGSGKSTTALACRHSMQYGAVIDIDNLRQCLAKPNWFDVVEYEFFLGQAISMAQTMCQTGKTPIILADTFAGNRLERTLEVFSNRKCLVVSLSVPLNLLIDRITKREKATSPPSSDDHIRKVIQTCERQYSCLDDTINKLKVPVLEIDTSTNQPHSVALMINQRLGVAV